VGWDSKLSYPPGATCSVSVKATPSQKAHWEDAARRHGKASAEPSWHGPGMSTSLYKSPITTP
jgi:hypothetical protein